MFNALTTHEVFRGAAKRLTDDVGWCQKNFTSEDDKECPVQAIVTLSGGSTENHLPVLELRHAKILEDVLMEHTSDYEECRRQAEEQSPEMASEARVITGAIWRWNDLEGRTPEEVVQILELAASSAEIEWWTYNNYLLSNSTKKANAFDVYISSADRVLVAA